MKRFLSRWGIAILIVIVVCVANLITLSTFGVSISNVSFIFVIPIIFIYHRETLASMDEYNDLLAKKNEIEAELLHLKEYTKNWKIVSLNLLG